MDCEDKHLLQENDILGQKAKLKFLLCTAPTVSLKHSAPDNIIVVNLYFKYLQKEENLAFFSQLMGFQVLVTPKEICCKGHSFNLNH